MLFRKQLDLEGISSLLDSLSAYTEDILLNGSSKLSYQLAYDHVFQLYQNEKQEQLLETIYSSIRRVLPKVFQKLQLQSNNLLVEIAGMIQGTERNLQTINRVCLYLDLNYCKKDKNIKLIDKLNEIFLVEFFKRQQLLSTIGKTIAQYHIKASQRQLEPLLTAIKVIDKKQDYFAIYFLEHYLPVVLEFLRVQSQSQFTEHDKNETIQDYIKYARQRLESEERFLQRYWPDNKRCGANKAFIMRQIYDVLVTSYKQKIYENHKDQLFNELTLQILELFKFNPKSNDIEKHADWYNSEIKSKLSMLPQQNNAGFIVEVCQFYKKIMNILVKTHNKFDIHYRSRFAFEEWINSQRLQMPLRLNDFINQYCLSRDEKQSTQNLQRINIMFVLMKEKNLFEKNYRRQLIHRMVNDFGSYLLSREYNIVQIMEKECSQQFVKNISPILKSYELKSKQLAFNHHDTSSNPKGKLNVLLLNVENWPYDEKNTSILLDQHLTKMVQKDTLQFNEQNNDKSMYWHPIIGAVRLSIKQLKSSWDGQLITDTCMANLLLHFIKTNYKPYELKSFCLQTGYKPDDIYESVKKMLHTKVLINQGSDESYILAINEDFSHSTNVLDVLNFQMSDKFESKPLEELKADRKFMVEAIIVKLMKKLKNTDKETILKETAPLIEKRGFSFNAKFVQSAIERLIDKEFIRDHEDGKYGYIA